LTHNSLFYIFTRYAQDGKPFRLEAGGVLAVGSHLQPAMMGILAFARSRKEGVMT